MATKDYFLKIEGIEGESSASKHKGEIDVESFGWGESRRLYLNPGDQRNTPLEVKNFHFTAFTSKASTKLMNACATAQKYEKAIFTLRKAGGEQEEYMKFTFYDVRVASYDINGPATEARGHEKSLDERRENPVPLESVVLNFAEIHVEYREQKSPGHVGSPNVFKYNLKQGKPS
jgi:type VI secretion system secreted protein Hcp